MNFKSRSNYVFPILFILVLVSCSSATPALNEPEDNATVENVAEIFSDETSPSEVNATESTIISPEESSLEISCGQTIMEDTTLIEDLDCPPGTPFAIIIGAPNITLDLGGHVVSGYVSGDFGGGVTAENVEGITIRNGTLEGFLGAISLIVTDNATIENMTIRNLDTGPDFFVVGIVVAESQGVVVKDILFEFLPVIHKEAVIIDNSEVSVSNIETHNASVGVNFGGACAAEPRWSSGTIFNNRFVGITGSGILVQCTNNAHISNNAFIQNEKGIYADTIISTGITGLVIEKNQFIEGYLGINLTGVIGAIISENVVKDNGHWGIVMGPSPECANEESVFECFCSTGNTISGNETSGNLIDLYHHEDCTGNFWSENTCETKEGIEIPECN